MCSCPLCNLLGELTTPIPFSEASHGRFLELLGVTLAEGEKERDQYKALARELAAELLKWFEYRPLAWRFDPAAWVGPSEIERQGFLALYSSATALLCRPEVKALMGEEK